MSEKYPPMRCRSLWLPRRGNSADEYEDASACDADHGRFAIADGASESSFAGLWAQLLVDGFVKNHASGSSAWSDWLPPLQERWLAEVSGKPLPWFAENKVQQGAFATFFGLSFHQRGWLWRHWVWQASAIGDSCLFQVRDGVLRRAFPITRADAFGNTPFLVGSRSATDASLASKEIQANGDLQLNDRLWLMTDALAQWFLHEFEAGQKPWELLESILAAPVPADAFAVCVEELRNSGALHNDDVTLVAIGQP